MTALDDLRKEISDLREEISDLRSDMRRFMRDRQSSEKTRYRPLDYGDFLGDRPTRSTADNSVDFETFYRGEPE